MTIVILCVVVLVVALAIWFVRSRSRATSASARANRDAIVERLQAIEVERQALIGEAGQRGVTISRDKALRHIEALRDSHLASGDGESARDVQQIIDDFRSKYGPEIPIEAAHALVREIESKFGQ